MSRLEKVMCGGSVVWYGQLGQPKQFENAWHGIRDGYQGQTCRPAVNRVKDRLMAIRKKPFFPEAPSHKDNALVSNESITPGVETNECPIDP